MASCTRRSGSISRPVSRRPEIADWHRDPVFAALGFRLDSLDQPTTHQRQLELAHRALEAEQQAIVGDAGIVHAIEIDDPRAHETTELEHVMPVPPVARQTRGFEAQHGADGPLTQLRHQRFEAGRATSPLADRPRSSSIVTTSRKPYVRARSLSSYLATLAFQVILHLGAGRLPHIDNRAALQYVVGQLTASHRVPRDSRPACTRWSTGARGAARPRPA